MDANYFNWLALGLALLFSFLLSGLEAGVFALNQLRVRRLARTGKWSAQLLRRFLENPERFLWTILVGNTLANFMILGFAITRIHGWFQGNHVLIIAVFIVVVFLFYTFFDLLPKMLFSAFPNQLCLAVAGIFRPVNFILSPLVSVVEGTSQAILGVTGGQNFTGRLFGSREEMRAVMRESAPALTGDEHAMINRVLDLQNITVRQITLPLEQTVTVQTQTPLGEALALAREKQFSRLPVWEMRGGKKRIGGVLLLGRLLFRDDLDLQKPVAAHMTPALFFGEDTRLEAALRRMQRAGERLAVVLARDGTEIGIVSMEHILKVIFGEMKL
ncbi:MAG TPA: CNNM domain-containing protein [Verrucomicrobiae bacterium]|jgi:CBS domain containing-hemolysin-like protein